MSTPQYFEPWPLHPSVQRLLETARATNQQRDNDERQAGFVAGSDLPPRELLRNALSAFYSGLKMRRWDQVAEGVAMVQEVERVLPDEAPSLPPNAFVTPESLDRASEVLVRWAEQDGGRG